ncbi:MAG: hypothetical protein NDI63_02800 [Pseudobdellovibrio sp.]|nr:hypothetical protein [Pseudobdellovibrio sp.]
MNASRLIIILSLALSSLYAQAEALSCKNLFSKEYDVQEFVIQINGKKESERYLETAHTNLISSADLAELKTVLMTIRESGLADITPEQKVMINKFRQDTSFLRSVFQTSSKKHISPEKYAKFVRDFGHLKDMVNIGEGVQAQKAAKKLLKKFVEVDFEGLLKDIKPASRKSVKKYFEAIITDTRLIMSKQVMEVDELHDVRKNMRDILRFMQIQSELKISGEVRLNADKNEGDNEQIDFLKKLNKKLGEVCDDYAAQIIRGEITDTTLVEFPEKLRNRVEWFLERYRYEGEK